VEVTEDDGVGEVKGLMVLLKQDISLKIHQYVTLQGTFSANAGQEEEEEEKVAILCCLVWRFQISLLYGVFHQEIAFCLVTNSSDVSDVRH
jgi:hypothetical protein